MRMAVTRARATSSGADGLLIVDKPTGWTSHDVVGRVRRLCGTRRVGHAGTLDPMATGVLVLGVNRATKLLTFLVGCDKTYTATIRLGQATVTDDAEGAATHSADACGITRTDIDEAVRALTGPILQVPSSVSAIKIDGERSYARVRQGQEVELAARPVTVSRFDIRDLRSQGELLDIDVEVDVSSGTYVRALARDLGSSLGVGGHLTALRRTRVGRFTLAHAHDLEALTGLADADEAAGGERGAAIPLLSMGDTARAQFPVHALTDEQARTVGYGQRIPSSLPGEDVVAAIGTDGSLVAMLDESGPLARAHVVFQPS